MLKKGDKAPKIKGLTQSGNEIDQAKLNDKTIILYFYPKDNTPGCTTEAIEFNNNIEKLSTKEVIVIGVSKDSVKSHSNFCKKYNLSFDLISDENLELIESYNVWQEKKNYGKTYMGIVRSTFIIENNIIKEAFYNVKVKGHVERVLNHL